MKKIHAEILISNSRAVIAKCWTNPSHYRGISLWNALWPLQCFSCVFRVLSHPRCWKFISKYTYATYICSCLLKKYLCTTFFTDKPPNMHNYIHQSTFQIDKQKHTDIHTYSHKHAETMISILHKLNVERETTTTITTYKQHP